MCVWKYIYINLCMYIYFITKKSISTAVRKQKVIPNFIYIFKNRS